MLRLGIQIFTIGQVVLFVLGLSLLPEHWALSILLILLAGLFLNFSLHITVHHFVHFRFQFTLINVTIELLYSITLGLPYTFYKMQHFNHHRYNNQLGDFTSTWTESNGKLVPKNLLKYILFWWIPTQTNIFKRAEEDGDLKPGDKMKMGVQLIFILCIYLGLYFINPLYTILYLVMFYTGWSLVALTNFGQHLPIAYGESYSYLNAFYNVIFFNNGLHHEHHKKPNLNYNELKKEDVCELKMPHVSAGIFGNEALK